MKYNICIIRPKGYAHSDAFLELAELLAFGLEDLGHEAKVQYNTVNSRWRNIVLGCHLLDISALDRIPEATIILNTEQIDSPDYEHSSRWSKTVIEWARRFETWDYSRQNIATFAQYGVDAVKHMAVGFHPRLARIPAAQEQDIDVLFYGSLNGRRRRVLEGLRQRGAKVHAAFGVYGEERDRLVARSKVVLNMHFYQAQIFEIVRVFYLLTNSRVVVSEVNDPTLVDDHILDGIYGIPYDGLVSGCMRVLEDAALRKDIAARGFEAISGFPQREVLRELIGE